jgi:hypothetical protein
VPNWYLKMVRDAGFEPVLPGLITRHLRRVTHKNSGQTLILSN